VQVMKVSRLICAAVMRRCLAQRTCIQHGALWCGGAVNGALSNECHDYEH
jgi:hypothetical protein